jgi:hypothetical protein
MSKKLKDKIGYLLTLAGIIIAAILIVQYFARDNEQVFYERLREDNEICYQRAKRDSVDTRWCDEIEKAANLAYRESQRGSGTSFTLLILLAGFFAQSVAIVNLRKQVDELKEKINV